MSNQLVRNDIFGVTYTPFLIPPDKPFLDDNRTQCMEQLQAFLHTRGFAAIAGRPGTGKTALVRYFTDKLHKPSHHIIYLPFSNLSENDLLKAICTRFQIEPPHFKNKTIAAIQRRIADIQPVNPLIVLDEMQNATPRIMDAIRLLANDNFDVGNKLSVILIGTREFFDKLRLAVNESLTQRITWFHHIHELKYEATTAYINHCLCAAGATYEIFETSAIRLIHDLSSGTVRLINKLALASLALASREESPQVCLQHVHAIKDQAILAKPETHR